MSAMMTVLSSNTVQTCLVAVLGVVFAAWTKGEEASVVGCPPDVSHLDDSLQVRPSYYVGVNVNFVDDKRHCRGLRDDCSLSEHE